jgi:hypothetical protein
MKLTNLNIVQYNPEEMNNSSYERKSIHLKIILNVKLCLNDSFTAKWFCLITSL